MSGLTNTVHLASHCYINTALDTLVDVFATFTTLRSNSNLLKSKNIHCVNCLLQFSLDDRDFLKGAWRIIVECISSIDKLGKQNPIDYSLIDALIESSKEF